MLTMSFAAASHTTKKSKRATIIFTTKSSAVKKAALEINIILKDGSQCWEQLKFVNIFDRDSKPLKAIVTVEDTTLQHKINDENKNIRESGNTAHCRRTLQPQHRRYEVASKTTYTDEQTAAAYNLRVAANIPESFIEKGIVLPESIDEYRRITKTSAPENLTAAPKCIWLPLMASPIGLTSNIPSSKQKTAKLQPWQSHFRHHRHPRKRTRLRTLPPNNQKATTAAGVK